jgi:hypothetical protein
MIGQYAPPVLFIGSCSLRGLADVAEEARLRGRTCSCCLHEDCDGSCELTSAH